MATNPFKGDNEEPTPSDSKETTPLVSVSTPASKEGGFSLQSAIALKDKATESLKTIAQKAVIAKNSMKKSPWILSLIILVSSFGVIAAGVFGLVTYLVRLHFILVVIKVYQIFFGILSLVVETSRYYNLFNIKVILHRWAPVLELTIGRGMLYILTSGLALASDWTIGEALPGILLALCGIFNIVWGIKAAIKVKRLFEKLRTEIREESGDDGTCILLIQKKFAALDLNGDGRLSKEELDIGCKTLNIDLAEGELDTIFNLLDPKNKGYIGIDEFEHYWYGSKDLTAFIV